MTRRGPKIYQRQDGRWSARITLPNHKRKTLYGRSKREVQDKVNKALKEKEQGTLRVGPRLTVQQYMEYWLEDVHKAKIKLPSYIKYRSILNNHINPGLGHIQLQQLTADDIQIFYSNLLKKGLSPKMVKVVHTVLHSALQNAVKKDRIAVNVSDKVDLPRIPSYKIQPLTPDQAQQLLQAAKGHRLETIITIALVTGMRRGELLALRWNDIDFETSSIQVHRTVDRLLKHGYQESEPKTAGSRRRVVLPQFAIEALRQHRTRQLETRQELGPLWSNNDLVFPNSLGGFLDPSRVLKEFKAILKNAGLPHMRFHDLRHSAATLLLTMGVHPKVVQELLGHSQVSMTIGTYSHVLPSMQKEAADKLDTMFRGANS